MRGVIRKAWSLFHTADTKNPVWSQFYGLGFRISEYHISQEATYIGGMQVLF